jgi:hypothetical protein
MKKTSLGSAVVIFLALAVVNPVSAELIQKGDGDFIPPELAGLGDALLPAFVDIPLNETVFSINSPIPPCIFGGSIGLSIDADVSLTDVGYEIYFDTSGAGELVVFATAGDFVVEGSLNVFVAECELIPFIPISFSVPLVDPEVSIALMAMAFVSTPYLNTDTGQIVLATRPDSLIAIVGVELLWDLFGFEEIFEAYFEQWLRLFLSDLLLNHGALATQSDGGAIHDLLEKAMDAAYIPPLPCGSVTVTAGRLSAWHLVANMAVYLLPVGLILGLKRRMKRS